MQAGLEVQICQEHLFQLTCLLSHTHPLRIVDHLVSQLLLTEARALATATGASEESTEQVLLLRVELSDTHVDHITGFDA